MSGGLVVGVDLGGTKIAAGLVGADGVLQGAVRRVATPIGPAAVLAAIAGLVRVVDPDGIASAVGVGSAGVFDTAGRVVSATAILPGWVGTDVAGRLRGDLGRPVAVLNDVHAAALGEAAFGAARGTDRALIVAIGTGIGGGLVVGGQVDPGPHGLAGSIGHVPVTGARGRQCSCGATGHLEALASGPAMEADYLAATGRALALSDLAPDDPEADAVIRRAATALGEAIAAGAALLDPDIVVIGGGVAELGDRLLGPLRESFRAGAFPAVADRPIVAAALGATAAIIGAALAAAR